MKMRSVQPVKQPIKKYLSIFHFPQIFYSVFIFVSVISLSLIERKVRSSMIISNLISNRFIPIYYHTMAGALLIDSYAGVNLWQTIVCQLNKELNG